MQYYKQFLLIFLMGMASSRNFEKHQDYEENTDLQKAKQRLDNYHKRNGLKETPLDIFIDTLLASEKYLKKIDVVERRLHHLDTSLHDRTNTMLKYLSEMMKMTNAAAPEMLMTTLSGMKSDWEKLKISLKKSFGDESVRNRQNGFIKFPLIIADLFLRPNTIGLLHPLIYEVDNADYLPEYLDLPVSNNLQIPIDGSTVFLVVIPTETLLTEKEKMKHRKKH